MNEEFKTRVNGPQLFEKWRHVIAPFTPSNVEFKMSLATLSCRPVCDISSGLLNRREMGGWDVQEVEEVPTKFRVGTTSIKNCQKKNGNSSGIEQSCVFLFTALTQLSTWKETTSLSTGPQGPRNLSKLATGARGFWKWTWKVQCYLLPSFLSRPKQITCPCLPPSESKPIERHTRV